jgi:hypothetical protein
MSVTYAISRKGNDKGNRDKIQKADDSFNEEAAWMAVGKQSAGYKETRRLCHNLRRRLCRVDSKINGTKYIVVRGIKLFFKYNVSGVKLRCLMLIGRYPGITCSQIAAYKLFGTGSIDKIERRLARYIYAGYIRRKIMPFDWSYRSDPPIVSYYLTSRGFEIYDYWENQIKYLRQQASDENRTS